MLNRREFLAALASTAYGAAVARALGGELLPRRPPPLDGPVQVVEEVSYQTHFFRTTEMIGRVTGESAVINLITAVVLSEGVLARVRWAANEEELPDSPAVSPVIASAEPSARMELPISGLEPNQEYVYRVEFTSAASPARWFVMDPIGEFRSQKTPGQSFSFCVAADGHWGQNSVPVDSPRRWTGEQCLQRVLEDGPFDFMIDLGDGPFPAVRSAANALDRYMRYRDVMAPITCAMPAYLVLGNHECEAGFYQRGTNEGSQYGDLWNHLYQNEYRQLWNTQARLLSIPNPRGDTYPEGGEGAPGCDSLEDWFGEAGPWNDGAPLTHLQNFYAWTWGDALFVVLDPFRCTLVGSVTFPNSPSQYTLGPTQLQWLADVLAGSTATWKFVIAHHQVGGGLINRGGFPIVDGGTEYAYGRGSAIEADRPDTEQAVIHNLMLQYGAQFFVYGHDHGFCHSVKDGIHYLCCGRTTFLNTWWQNDGMLDSYGSILTQGQEKPWVQALYSAVGYARFLVTPGQVTVQWIRTGYSFEAGVMPVAAAQRDWRESWAGREYSVDSPAFVTVRYPPTDVDGVRTVSGALVPAFFQVPPGVDYYLQPDPVRPEDYANGTIPLAGFPDGTAVVDTVPELIHEVSFET